MSYLNIPRFYPRQLVRVSTVYLFPDEAADHALARVRSVQRDPRDLQAPMYTVQLLTGAHSGQEHEALEVALTPLGMGI
jgi:hypothetical protein